MISFFISVAALILGYLLYGKFVERVFGPDPSRKTPAITKAEFERYMLSGSTYAPNDEGTKLVGDLSMSLASGYGVGDITIASVSVVDDSDSPQTQTVSISSAVLTSALSSGGYTETSPGLFSSLTFNTLGGIYNADGGKADKLNKLVLYL